MSHSSSVIPRSPSTPAMESREDRRHHRRRIQCLRARRAAEICCRESACVVISQFPASPPRRRGHRSGAAVPRHMHLVTTSSRAGRHAWEPDAGTCRPSAPSSHSTANLINSSTCQEVRRHSSKGTANRNPCSVCEFIGTPLPLSCRPSCVRLFDGATAFSTSVTCFEASLVIPRC